MNKSKGIAIGIIIVIILIIAIIIGLLIFTSDNGNEATPEMAIEEQLYDDNLTSVSTKNNYYIVKTCIEKFYLYLTEVDTSEYTIIDEDVEATIEEEEKMYAEAIYAMLDSRYIEYNSITINNLYDEISQIEESKVIIDSMYVSEKSANMSVYLVNGRIRNSTSGEKTEFSILVEIDMLNDTFAIILSDYFEENIGEIVIGEKLNLEVDDEIEANDYNQFDYSVIDTETYILDMFADFKYDMMYDYELAYEKLDEEYSSVKFESYEDFEEYAKSKVKNSVIMKVSSYQVNEYDDYTQYVILDQNDNYYIFNVTGVMQYGVILDTYTIDIPEFTDKYNDATEQEKVILNLNKINLAINDGDYKYVYRVLADSFKQNYFSDYETFENYIKNNFFEDNEFDYSEYGTNAGYYTYKINIADGTGTSSDTVTKTFIMSLGDGTDFEVSFNVE